jgi:hypothetical protein
MNAKQIEQFRQWLSRMGAEVLMPTNPYELARFIARGGTHVIYVNGKGRISANGFAAEVLAAFESGQQIDMGFAKTSRTSNGRRRAVLLQRDGRACFYCGIDMPDDDITLEHLVALDKGGTNRLENMALAHRLCNNKAGNLTLTMKIKIRDRMRGYTA